jgi:hypothetical protein
MRKILLSLCLLASTCYAEFHTVSRYQIHLTDSGIHVEMGEDYYSAQFVIYAGNGMYYVDIQSFEYSEPPIRLK